MSAVYHISFIEVVLLFAVVVVEPVCGHVVIDEWSVVIGHLVIWFTRSHHSLRQLQAAPYLYDEAPATRYHR